MPDIKFEDLTIVCDNREQNPFDLSPCQVESGTLQTGDYGIKDMESICRVERKADSNELAAMVGRERERFERELERLTAFPVRCVVCECSWSELEIIDPRRKVTPAQIQGSVTAWMARFRTPFFFAGTRNKAERFTRGFLYHAAKYRLRETQQFLAETRT